MVPCLPVPRTLTRYSEKNRGNVLEKPSRPPTGGQQTDPNAPVHPSPAAPSDLVALVWALRCLVAAFEAATSRPALALLSALRGLLAIVAPHQGDTDAPRPTPVPTPAPSSSTTRSTAEPAPSLPPGQRRLWGHLAGGFEAWGQIGQTLAALDLTVRSLDEQPDQLGLQSELTDRTEELRAAHFDLAGMLCEASAEVTGLCVRDNPVAHAARLRELVDLDSPPWWIEHRRETILASAREAFAARTT